MQTYHHHKHAIEKLYTQHNEVCKMKCIGLYLKTEAMTMISVRHSINAQLKSRHINRITQYGHVSTWV